MLHSTDGACLQIMDLYTIEVLLKSRIVDTKSLVEL